MNNDDNSNSSKENQYIDIETLMKEAIKNSKFVDHVVMGNILDDVTSNRIIELLETPKKFKIGDKGLMYESDDGELEECPNYGVNISSDGKWLSDKISSIPFDIEQNGNVRKATEAQSAYCLIVLNEVLNDSDIKTEITDIVNNYDYESMVPHDGRSSFEDLLKSYLNLQSTIINVAVSAAKYRISDIKKDSEKFLKENIPEDRLSGLRELDVALSEINRSYSLGSLSPINVKQLTKLEVLEKMKERDDKIDLILNGGINENGMKISSHPESTIWKILNLSSEYIDPLTKRKVLKLADDEVSKLYTNNPHLVKTQGESKQTIEKWKKRYIKVARLSVRKTQIEKFLANEAEYTLPVKL